MLTPTIETGRLILRPLTVDDAEDVFEWAGDERVARYMIYSVHTDTDVTRAWLSSIQGEHDRNYTWGFVRRTDGKLIGSGSIRYRHDENRWSFGYNIRYDCWNMGYTTEATLRMMDFARRRHNARRFAAECAVENTGSARVIEKCGLHFLEYCEYTKIDGSETFRAKRYVLNEE
ncbi:MAG: GNAT family N-acetyltransferase [Ruminococcus sp.]|nr:GNAT family N-acetyltransferase [Ruminococcus sp.]